MSSSVGTGTGAGPSSSRSAASRAVDAASSARNLQYDEHKNISSLSRERQMEEAMEAAPDAFLLDKQYALKCALGRCSASARRSILPHGMDN
jgi:hypothetical protein